MKRKNIFMIITLLATMAVSAYAQSGGISGVPGTGSLTLSGVIETHSGSTAGNGTLEVYFREGIDNFTIAVTNGRFNLTVSPPSQTVNDLSRILRWLYVDSNFGVNVRNVTVKGELVGFAFTPQGGGRRTPVNRTSGYDDESVEFTGKNCFIIWVEEAATVPYNGGTLSFARGWNALTISTFYAGDGSETDSIAVENPDIKWVLD